MNSHLVSIVSDVHFTAHHYEAWAAYKRWHAAHKPVLTIALGDLVDLASLSRFDLEEDAEVHAVSEIRFCAHELNELAKTSRVIALPGNHGDRWEKAIYGKHAAALKGAKGLTLREQFYAQGLGPSVGWFNESKDNPGLWIGKRAVLVMHGDKQASGFGFKHVAAGLLQRFPSTNVVVGHHHRGQLVSRTELGRTTFAIANPHLSGNHSYNVTPDWQRGFTVLEFYGRSRLRDCVKVTPRLVLMDEDGHFAYGGEVY